VGEIERPSTGEHGVGERGGFAAVEPTQVGGHEERGHLIVGDLAGGIPGGQGQPLGGLEAPSVPLSRDQAGREH
jgi:hypothetical protein